MTEMVRSPKSAPEYANHRNVTVDDTLPITVENHGMNMRGYEYAHIQVTPIGTANPTIQIQFWNDEAGQYCDLHSALIYAGKGANIPYEITVSCRGRLMHVAVTAGTGAGSTMIKIAGANLGYR